MGAELLNKTFVVSGATSGIGFSVADQLVGRGAQVIGIGRSAERCREAERRLNHAGRSGAVVYCVADLSLQSQVQSVADTIRCICLERNINTLDGLVNNAATFMYWMELTSEGFETQWAVNYLAAFRLTHELLPLLQNAPCARVVSVSSDSHYGIRLNWEDIQLRRHYNGLRAYGQTKLAAVLFTQELNRRRGAGSPVRAFAADPGLVKTDIGLKGTPALVRWVWERRRAAGISPEESAQGIVYLLCEPSIQDREEVYWKHGVPKAPSRQAQDLVSARRLWTLSEKMCGLSEENQK